MDPYDDRRLLTSPARGSWLQRVLLALLGAALVVVAFFFVTVALIAAAFLALAIGVRWWWVMRKVRAHVKASEALEGEYTVIERARPGAQRIER